MQPRAAARKEDFIRRLLLVEEDGGIVGAVST
jgi:hypothetical protein